MISTHTLSATFRNGDLPWRPRRLGQYWVVQVVKNDPVRAVEVYGHLIRHGGSDHAAALFLELLREAHERPFAQKMRMLWQSRPAPRPLPV